MKPRHVFSDELGNIYAVTFDGDLLWYGDVNRDGTPGWAQGSGNRVGNGWQEEVRHAFSGGDGIIYAIDFDGFLFWYKDENRNGTAGWAARSGSRIGSMWQEVRLAFYGGDGIIYAIKDNGDLFYFRDAHRNGTPGWASGSGNRIGSGWQAVRLAWTDLEEVSTRSRTMAICSGSRTPIAKAPRAGLLAPATASGAAGTKSPEPSPAATPSMRLIPGASWCGTRTDAAMARLVG